MTISKNLRRNWRMTAAACVLTCAGAGVAFAQQGGGAPAGAGSSQMDHGGMPMGGAGGSGQSGMDHGGMGHGGGMDHGGMMGQGMMGGMDHGATGGGAGGHGGMMMGHMMCRTTEHVEGRLAYLKAELKLTDAQTPQWNAFADAVKSSTQKAGQACASMHEHGGSESSGMSGMSGGVLQHLGMMEKMMGAHLEEIRAIKAAAEPLFAVLTDEQKKIADQTMTGMMGFGMGMGKM
jgi:hypothetical protein